MEQIVTYVTCPYYSEAPIWTNPMWMEQLQKGSIKKRFEYLPATYVQSKVTLEETKLVFTAR